MITLPSTAIPEKRSTASLLRDWDQIEGPDDVARVLRQIRDIPSIDAFRCPELYDLAYPGYDGDSQYYRTHAASGAVLYLGVGTGRLFVPIAEGNSEAIGLDSSLEMTELFRDRYPHLRDRIQVTDAITGDLSENQYDAIIAPYSFLQVLPERGVADLLANIRRSLKPGGNFHTDIFSAFLIPFRRSGLETCTRNIVDVTCVIYVLYDHRRQSMTETAIIRHNGAERALTMKLRYYFPRELESLFLQAGFRDVAIKGGYCGESFDPSRNDINVFVVRK